MSNPTQGPIIATKLHLPRPRPNGVTRPRLTERLEQGLTRPLTLLSAPAGFGKTTLISNWKLIIDNCQMAWLSLDDDDNDPTRFWSYVIAALQTINAGLGTEAQTLLQSPQPPSLKTIISALLNDLDALDTNVLLVLDDYHLIESQAIHDALLYLLDHLPQQLHIVIATRTDPPLPLPRLRVRDQLVEIRAADLRFTLEEAATFLNQVMGLGLTPQDVATLEGHTEGWIAGLQLAALSMQGRNDVSSFVAAFAGSHRYVLDYLVEEVLRRQSESVQTFLIETSILDRLCGPLCDAVSGQSNSQAILVLLEQANLFTIPLDEERRWYRYHHLFAEFLRSRLEYTRPDRIPELHRRAAEWYEHNGLVAEAVPHALATQDWERAARLIEQTGQSFLSRGETATLRRWLSALPAETISARPRLCIAQAWMLVINLEGTAAEAYLQQAERSLGENDRDELLIEIMALRSFATAFTGDFHRAADLARQALARSPQGSPFLRSMSALDLGIASMIDGNVAAACDALAQATLLAEQARHWLVAILARCQWAEQLIYLGQLSRAAETYQQALKFEFDERLLPLLGMAYNGLGEVRRIQNRLDEAAQLLEKGIPLCLQWEEIAAMDGYISLARIRQAQGDERAANEIMQQASRFARKSDSSIVDDLLVGTYQARLWIAQGRLDKAGQWAQQFAAHLRGQEQGALIYSITELMDLALVRVWLAQGQASQALDEIERQTQAAEQRGRMGAVIEWLALQALAHKALGNTDHAMATLERALLLAEPEGYVRVFVDESEPMRLLIARMLASDDCRLLIARNESGESKTLIAYMDKLLAAFPQTTPAPKSEIRNQKHLHRTQVQVSEISERELEVLRLIAEGYSNQEIADKLVVALSTVKTHVNNLYSKLDVTNRVQAVSRAQELNLLHTTNHT
jgi:LuxR family maltose regulon positive regulatory protein